MLVRAFLCPQSYGYASSLGGGSIYAVGEVVGVLVWVKLQGMPVLWKALAPELTFVSFVMV